MLAAGEEGVDEGVAVLNVGGDVLLQDVVGPQARENGVEGEPDIGGVLSADNEGKAARTDGTEHPADDGVQAETVVPLLRRRGEVRLEGSV